MIAFLPSLLTASLVAAVLSVPSAAHHGALVPRTTGLETGGDGCYYAYWNDGTGSPEFDKEGGGDFRLIWDQNAANILGGKGWVNGTARNIAFTSDGPYYGNFSVGIYGWTGNPWIEYRVIEYFDPQSYPAPWASWTGMMSSDGSIYDVYVAKPSNSQSIYGNQTSWTQYWSIRQLRRRSGTVTMANHFNFYNILPSRLGTPYWQIVASEGHQGTGAGGGGLTISDVSVSNCTIPDPACACGPPVAKYGQCGGQGYTGCTCCVSGTTCQHLSSWYEQCLP